MEEVGTTASAADLRRDGARAAAPPRRGAAAAPRGWSMSVAPAEIPAVRSEASSSTSCAGGGGVIGKKHVSGASSHSGAAQLSVQGSDAHSRARNGHGIGGRRDATAAAADGWGSEGRATRCVGAMSKQLASRGGTVLRSTSAQLSMSSSVDILHKRASQSSTAHTGGRPPCHAICTSPPAGSRTESRARRADASDAGESD
eukprot:scaffold6088_cov128-Isochrysis_galbana.AAC.4